MHSYLFHDQFLFIERKKMIFEPLFIYVKILDSWLIEVKFECAELGRYRHEHKFLFSTCFDELLLEFLAELTRLFQLIC